MKRIWSSWTAGFWSLTVSMRAAAEDRGAPNEIADALEHTHARVDVLRTRLAEIGDRAIELLPLVGLALAVVALSWLIARIVTKGDWLFRWIGNRFLRDLVRQFSAITLVGIGVLVALELLDATALFGAALGAAGVVGVAVGFAFRDIMENYLAGLLLSMRRPFAPNDFVAIDGDEGRVVRLTSRATVLFTLEGNHLRIPNAKVFKAVLVNYTSNPLRQFNFVVEVSVTEDLVRAQALGVQTLSNMDAVIEEPPPFGLIQELGASSVPIRFHAWVDQTSTDFFKAKSEGIRLVKSAFDAENVEMPEPIYRVYVRETTPSPSQEVVRPTASLRQEGDTAADERLDLQVEAERAEGGPDLLDEDAPRE
ncbi:MAG: mechanosensitive ion channel family protein [Polyangiales bacterium]